MKLLNGQIVQTEFALWLLALIKATNTYGPQCLVFCRGFGYILMMGQFNSVGYQRN